MSFLLGVWPPKCREILSKPLRGTSLARNMRFGTQLFPISQEMRSGRVANKAKNEKNMHFLVYMYYPHYGYQTSLFGKNCTYYIQIFTGHTYKTAKIILLCHKVPVMLTRPQSSRPRPKKARPWPRPETTRPRPRPIKTKTMADKNYQNPDNHYCNGDKSLANWKLYAQIVQNYFIVFNWILFTV